MTTTNTTNPYRAPSTRTQCETHALCTRGWNHAGRCSEAALEAVDEMARESEARWREGESMKSIGRIESLRSGDEGRRVIDWEGEGEPKHRGSIASWSVDREVVYVRFDEGGGTYACSPNTLYWDDAAQPVTASPQAAEGDDEALARVAWDAREAFLAAEYKTHSVEPYDEFANEWGKRHWRAIANAVAAKVRGEIADYKSLAEKFATQAADADRDRDEAKRYLRNIADQRTVRDLLAEAVDIAAKRRDWVRGDNAALGREDDEYDGHRRDFDHDALKIALRLATVVDALSDEVCDLRERLAELEESRRG